MAVDQRVGEGDLLWTPSPEWIERTNIVAFTRWLSDERGLDFDVTDHHGYDEFWRWSVTDLEGFLGSHLGLFRDPGVGLAQPGARAP
jgi:hypothetical protein